MLYLDLGGKGPGLVRPEDALIPFSDRGFLYGDGLFETMLVRNQTIPLLPWHIGRLSRSAKALAIPLDTDRLLAGIGTLVQAVTAHLASDPAADAGRGEFALRITLTRGSAEPQTYEPSANPKPTVLITWRSYQRTHAPLSAITAAVRNNPGSPICQHKTTSALERVVARAEAARAGCDEALVLTPAGHVAEGSYTNLFLVKQGLWLTPPLSDGCLPGVMRRRVMELTHAVEWSVTREDLFHCDGVYLTNGLMGMRPLAALDGRSLPWGAPPPWADRLFTPVERPKP